MWRRRWRYATIVAFLIFITKETQCQGDNDFYYTPERSFAQVQPPIFSNSRPSNYYDNGGNYRSGQTVQPPSYNDGRVRFPSPNYDQNPSPFQLPTGRSQSSSQYYINQPDVSMSQRQRFRPALPYNFQLVHPHPASTKRPDLSQIHSVAYQNDPSKPETFLGQITINNPDVDYLQNSRFKNIPFDGNSLKSNGQSGHIAHDDEIDNDDHDFFDHHKVTTYNPTKNAERQKINIKPNSARFTHFETRPTSEVKQSQYTPVNRYIGNDQLNPVKSISNLYQGSSTEYKSLLDLEPLLEDDISDITSFRELMKNTQGSFDVQVIKSNKSKDSDDSKPDASSMNSENLPNNLTFKIMSDESTQSPKIVNKNNTVTKIYDHDTNEEDINEEDEVGEEYVEYYEDAEDSTIKHTTTKPFTTTNSEPVTDIYDEYDSSDEPEKSIEETKVNKTNSFDVLDMKPNKTMVKDDNFQQFVDSTVIDQTDLDSDNDTTSESLKFTFSNEDVSSIETPSILGQEVVSVVTTKSVVNGTISIPDVTYPPTPTTKTVTPVSSSESNDSSAVSTESWIVVASVQTSRSVSGARFLPFPTVEQEEKKQVLMDEDEETITDNPKQDYSSIMSGSSSTENINDKLDSIQSELSSAVLSGNLNNENKNIELITETTSEPNTSTTSTTTPSVINVFTLKSTQYAVVTEKSFPEPLPVQIKKFAPRLTTSTTPKPKKKLVTIMDDLSGLLPAGYKSRQSYKNKRTSTTSTTTSTTTTTTTTTTSPPPRSSTEDVFINGTQGRSSGISSKNKVIILDDKSLLPKEYKPKERNLDIIFKQNQDDINKFLPSGYKLESNKNANINKTTNLNTLKNVKEIDISSFLPKGFQLNTTSSTTTTTEKNKIFSKTPVHTSDIAAFLPPGFNINSSESEKNENLLSKFKITDVGNFLPADFKLDNPEENQTSTTSSPGGFKLVFPSRPGGKTTRKSTTQKSSIGPPLVTPKIHKGWQTRATTEFTGWPSPSTTPFSLEKLLELQRNATSTTPMNEVSTESTTRRILTTTTTTPAPPQPTTPGVCRHDCDIAGTIKIVSGVTWIPELLDQHTREWQQLAKEVKQELNTVYSKSDVLNKWYKGIRIDGFSEGSVLVDYFIELNNVEERVDTYRLKKLFHKSLHVAKAGSVVEEEINETFDPDVMVGDQPDEERLRKSDAKMTKTIDKSAGKLEMGKFVMDPAYTEFIVLPKREEPTFVLPDEESLLPQWGIAVIVIALASLLFVVIFGVTVLVNRQKSTKTKQPIPLSEDMLRELDKSHMGGFDDNMHQLKERDMPYLPSGKRMSQGFIEQLAYPNPGDSWRSEWTPQLQKYMQHYAPDSGRGSQIYGTTGNGYGGGGSQLYGQTGAGAGSQGYGYTGEFPRSHYSRRRSEYDSNF